jgi:hypothetical protein
MNADDRRIALYRRINGATGPLARTAWHWRTRWVARALALFTWLRHGGQRCRGTMAIAEEWRRLFGLPQFWTIERLEDDTAYCDIRFPCSLEGSGDVAACHRLMEYDRALLRRIGGQLVVLQSRADPAVRGACRVAIRRLEDRRDDLIPARRLD